ncbi:PAS/PAC sensor hybrid histidine kinase [Thermanaerovibrio acidaminovorans DSM 6589]|uniref:histidine kinase n=1 Tax=Thermanaerovibrio acidaminovorans (strain ATCC 49978 / DSM 6589 / Su883) TaxID=525903 RepID=D1B6G2_THEAS|nr:PAS domain S-box protein [Thermanaerovibrio acidaminovorans]ACZ19603.1 PAS/PAC sensor hybrid histidine kinase [Thermanaerovibrio acidaminovorans DSM 6589]
MGSSIPTRRRGLRFKAALALGSFMALMVLVLLTAGYWILHRGFEKLEVEDARKDLDRVETAIDTMGYFLQGSATDWGRWDDTYLFATNRNPGYIRNNLNEDSLRALNANLFLIFDREGSPLFGALLPQGGEMTLLSGEDIRREGPVRSLGALTGNPNRGVLFAFGMPMMIAHSPILTSLGEGPSAGRLVLGRALTSEEFSWVLKMDVMIDSTSKTGDLSDGSHRSWIHPVDHRTLKAHRIVPTLDGNGVLVTVTRTRDIYAHEERTLWTLGVLLASIGLMGTLGVNLITRRMVLDPLEGISSRIHRIAQSGRFDEALPVEGDDELSDLAEDVNLLLRAVVSSQERLADLSATLESLSDGVLVCDPDGRVVNANASAASILGVPEGEVRGRDFMDLIALEHGDLRGVPQVHASFGGVVSVRGEDRFLEGSVSSIVGPNGDVTGSVTVFRDVTQDRRNREELKEREAFQRELLEIMPVGVMVVDPESRSIESVNPHAVKLLGVEDPSQLVGRRCHGSVCPALEGSCPICDLGNPMDNAERTLLRSDGSQPQVLKTARMVTLGGRRKLLEVFMDISTLKHMEEELRRANERLDLVIRGTNDGIYDWDFASGSLYLSPRWKQILGYQDNELENSHETFVRLLHPDDRPRVEEYLGLYLEGRVRNYSIEFRMIHKDGSVRWILSKGTAVRDRDGRPIRMAGSHSDITDRKMAEEELIRRAEILSGLTSAANNLINVPTDSWDEALTSSLAAVGDALGAIGGYAFSYDDRREAAAMTHRWAPMGHEFPKTGEIRYHLMGPMREAHRNGLAFQVGDLRELPQGDPMGEMMKSLGVTGLVTVPILGPEGCHGFVCFGWDVPNRLNDDQLGLLSLLGIMLKATMDRLSSLAETLEAKRRAEEASAAKSAFLANMSHEIRTPMNAILGYTQILERDPSLGPKQREKVQAIIRSGNHLLELLNDLLDLSKIEAGVLEIRQEVFPLRKMLQDVEVMFRGGAEAKGLHLLLEGLDQAPHWVSGDQRKLRQVLVNLLGNAIKFTSEGMVVLRAQEIHRDQEGGRTQLRFQVEDTGPGIPEEELEVIFDPFGQGSVGLKAGGTGLGLAISKRIVEAMGGDIRVSSQVGHGTVFTVTVPLGLPSSTREDLPGEVKPVGSVVGIQGDGGLKRILVVDDDRESREVLRHLLEEVGFLVDQAEDGEQAVRMVTSSPPDLIITDLHMPRLGGAEAARIIGQSARSPVPILIMSGSRSADVKEDLSWASGILLKPVDAEELYRAVGRALGVSYVYREERREGWRDDAPRQNIDLPPSPEAATLLDAIQDAVLMGDVGALEDAIGKLGEISPGVAGVIGAMAERFDYEGILKLLEGGKRRDDMD